MGIKSATERRAVRDKFKTILNYIENSLDHLPIEAKSISFTFKDIQIDLKLLHNEMMLLLEVVEKRYNRNGFECKYLRHDSNKAYAFTISW